MQTEVLNRSTHGLDGQRQSDKFYFGKTKRGVGSIPFGVLLISFAAASCVMLPYAQRIELSGLGPSNVLTGKVVVNGLETTVTETYAISTNDTLTALKVKIKAVSTAAISDVIIDGNNFYLVPNPDHEVYFKDFSVSGGSAVTVTHDLARKPIGAAEAIQKQKESDGTIKYTAGEPVSVQMKGEITLICEDTDIDPDINDVYVRIIPETGKQVGVLKKSADSGKAVLVDNIKFLTRDINNQVKVLIS